MSEASKHKNSMVVGLTPADYEIIDFRMNKPTFHFTENDSGSMLLQNIDTVAINKSRQISYFVPNNIGILMNISSRSIIKAKKIFNDKFKNTQYELDITKLPGNKKQAISSISSEVYDYIEEVQSAIVFAYTALEAFANLSIPADYTFSAQKNSKGIIESYDKNAIERWLSLKIKIRDILPLIYDTKAVDKQKWWGQFVALEEYRNAIIHQKSITSTDFYKAYFKDSIFNVIGSIEAVITFFYVAHRENGKTNEVWPWLKEYPDIPATEYKKEQFEVIGNVHQGIKKSF